MAKFDVRPDIDAAAEQLQSTLGSKREIQRLPEVLWEGETVQMLATGVYGKGNGLVAMTNKRLIFLKHGVMSQQLEDFPYGRISSVQWSGGMLMGTLTVFASGNKAEIKQMPKDAGKALADALRARLADLESGGAPAAPAAVPAAAGAQSVEARLQTLDQLRASGAITDEEYRDRRGKILDSL
ncbi:Short C-terminal domain-containing protein [Streptomyces sp. DI166]|uniref:PH domain-containing protein n=1 Tax=Streptomyces sp. DI166 TaxID=1839783 RepID=UPI0007F5516B|nr:PH domain-containing protein [Streptomyces sp. DI166]SBT89390.1 Short C-terminal domain-containing protein [Streptomyces sp. DI166]